MRDAQDQAEGNPSITLVSSTSSVLFEINGSAPSMEVLRAQTGIEFEAVTYIDQERDAVVVSSDAELHEAIRQNFKVFYIGDCTMVFDEVFKALISGQAFALHASIASRQFQATILNENLTSRPLAPKSCAIKVWRLKNTGKFNVVIGIFSD
jgi:hypothetical protein